MKNIINYSTMKKTFHLLTITAFFLILAGCEKYLDIKPRGQDVPDKLEHYEGLLLGKSADYLTVFPYMSFEYTADAGGYSLFYSTPGGAPKARAYKYEADIFIGDESSSEWNSPTSMFYTLNVIIEEVMDASDGTEDEKTAILAEAKMLRAWYTFLMAQNFGKPYNEATAATDLGVPIIKEASTTGTNYTRATLEETYDYILSEMKEALPLLQEREIHPLRVFSPTGNAMLGKVYWMMGKYDKALPYLESAMTKIATDSKAQLLDYNTMIYDGQISLYVFPNTTYNPESLYTISDMPKLWLAFYPAYYGASLLTLKKEVLQEYYTAGDCRLAFISGVESWETAYNSFDPSSPTEKYYPNINNMSSNLGITIPDIYLMYAECLARTNSLGAAKQTLFDFRSNRMTAEYAVVPSSVASQNDLIKFIVAERMRENMGSGVSWYDTRRLWNDPLFQDLKDYYTHTDGTATYTLTEERLTMRIPPSVMSWNPDFVNND